MLNWILAAQVDVPASGLTGSTGGAEGVGALDFMGVALWRYALGLLILILGFTLKKLLELVVVRRLFRVFS